MQSNQLLSVLNSLLDANNIKDYCPNGLQVEGKDNIQCIVTGVTASQALIEKAVELKADAIIVHHGYFWKNEAYNIVGMKKRRISRLLTHDINLFAYHLPLDVHSSLGNNAQLGKVLGLQKIEPLAGFSPEGIVMQGEYIEPMTHQQMVMHLENKLRRRCISVGDKAVISKVAWCTGGGQSYIEDVAERAEQEGIDAFLSGEISEQTTHSARELNLDYFATGHHATERYGVKALGEYLQEEFQLKVHFIDIDNPA